MQLFGAIFVTLLRTALIIAGLMAVLFVGYLVISEGGDSVRDKLETPEHLEELEAASEEQAIDIAEHHADGVEQQARRQALELRLTQERNTFAEELDEELEAIEEAAEEQIDDAEQALEDSQQRLTESTERLEARYCDSWNPINWWSCRKVRQQAEKARENVADREEALQEATDRFEEEAQEAADEHRRKAEDRFEEQTAEFEEQLDTTMAAMDDLEDERRLLERHGDELREEKAALREDNWLWIEFRERWKHLLAVALLIFLAPYLRRTLWYYAGMPMVSSADPIELAKSTSKSGDGPPCIECGESKRTLVVDVPTDERLLARIGYVQSDREGATSELFFDRNAPNLSYISGLVLMTQLRDHPTEDESRPVMLGTPHDPDAYLMRVDIENHPGVALRARHVVGVVGDVNIESTWRLTNLHAWATSQVRFIIFSGTGTLILEGYGDIHGRTVDDDREQKRMPLVVGFDTRLTYSTQRSATFLPYLVDPGREPLVVDVFEGTGTVFFEKNPSARKRHRTTGEAIAGFFLDAFRRLLGL